MKIGVIGAGISGLAVSVFLKKFGHDITVFEKNKNISEFGAGVQISSNGSMILKHLGVLSKTKEASIFPEKILFFDGEKNRNVGFIPLGKFASKRYGSEFMLIHRSDLVEILKNEVKSLDIDIHFNSSISIGKNEKNFIHLRDNKNIKEFSFAIAADGIKSKIRNSHFSSVKPKFLQNTC